jgi:predicted phosphodiesterase
MKKWSLYFVMLFIITLLFGCKDKEKVRIGFITDIHFDVPSGNQPFGGVELDGDTSDFEIPLRAKETLDSIQPAFIFDTGDLTVDGKDEEFTEYQKWREEQCAPIYPVMGNHDREHLKGQPYGTGFYSICKYPAATRTLQMGNIIFILFSEDHLFQDHPLTMAVSDQKIQWLKEQLELYSEKDNNIFIFSHYPLNNTVAWSNYWYGLNSNLWPAWERTSEKIMNLLKEYEDHVVAHISGHIHTHYAWKDHPQDFSEYGYGDKNYGVEHVGHFVYGKDLSQSRKQSQENLPAVYFLNPQALAYTHGSPYAGRWWDQNRDMVYGEGGEECISTSAVYYADFFRGGDHFNLITRDIHLNQNVDTFQIKTEFPIDLGKKKLVFKDSDLGIRSKDTLIRIEENAWFSVQESSTGSAVFQKAFPEAVDVKGIDVIAENGDYGKVKFKGSKNHGRSWSSWQSRPPENINALQVKVTFQANSTETMRVRNIKIY